jgi:hypothetical protein
MKNEKRKMKSAKSHGALVGIFHFSFSIPCFASDLDGRAEDAGRA